MVRQILSRADLAKDGRTLDPRGDAYVMAEDPGSSAIRISLHNNDK